MMVLLSAPLCVSQHLGVHLQMCVCMPVDSAWWTTPIDPCMFVCLLAGRHLVFSLGQLGLSQTLKPPGLP